MKKDRNMTLSGIPKTPDTTFYLMFKQACRQLLTPSHHIKIGNIINRIQFVLPTFQEKVTPESDIG
jgi:hypothetical protein